MLRMDIAEALFHVSPMQQGDVASVAAIEKAIFTLPWSSSAFGYELRTNPQAHYSVARTRTLAPPLPNGEGLDCSVIGYGGFWMMLDEAHICTLGVHPDWRRRGVGELLLATMVDRAARLDATYMTLEVRVSNLPAQRLYQKYGFAEAGVRKDYYSDNHEDALIMTTEPITTAAYQGRFNRLQRLLRARLLSQQPGQS